MLFLPRSHYPPGLTGGIMASSKNNAKKEQNCLFIDHIRYNGVLFRAKINYANSINSITASLICD